MGERLGNGAVRERWNDRVKVTGTTTIFIFLKFHVLPTFTQSGNVRCYRRDTNSTKVSLLHDAMHKWLELPNKSSKIKAEILPNGYLGWLFSVYNSKVILLLVYFFNIYIKEIFTSFLSCCMHKSLYCSVPCLSAKLTCFFKLCSSKLWKQCQLD